MADQIRVTVPACVNCQRLAVGFVRWPKWVKDQKSWSPRCDRHVPWQDLDAEIVAIRIDGEAGPGGGS